MPRDSYPPIPASGFIVGMRHALAVALLALASALPTPTRAATVPRLEGLGPNRGPVATTNARAQRWFGQGVVMVWGFNPAEAARAFEASTGEDPRCALCWWGLAWSLGPNVNADMRPEDAPRVADALAHARALAPHASPRDRALIDALLARHPEGRPIDEETYAGRMESAERRFPRDPDVAMLAAEALINLHPYDWWEPDGRAKPWTPAILRMLDRALALQPAHAGAHHYRIHVLESSPAPVRGLVDADALRTLVPGSGHLLHMPAHIFMRTGRYVDAITANQMSIEADRRYLASVDAQGAYRVGYVAHNHHFLWAAAAMDGQARLADEAARAAWPAACGPGGANFSSGILQHYYVLPLFSKVRFARWNEILTGTLPPDVALPYPTAMYRYARGTALLRTGRLDEARRELAALEAIAQDPALDAVRIKSINPARAMTRIAILTLRGDVAQVERREREAIAALTEAVAIEDGLSYDEPHLWLAPTRHALGAALLAFGRPADAERVYREDLAHYPDNAWSLAGLAQALERLGRTREAAQARDRWREATRRADVAITVSRL